MTWCGLFIGIGIAVGLGAIGDGIKALALPLREKAASDRKLSEESKRVTRNTP